MDIDLILDNDIFNVSKTFEIIIEEHKNVCKEKINFTYKILK